MRRSSNEKNNGVKQAAIAREMGRLLALNVKEIVEQGIASYLFQGKEVLLEALMEAEAEEKVGEPYKRDIGRQLMRWGRETGKAIVDGSKSPVRRPRLRVVRNLNSEGGEVQLASYKAMNRCELLDGPLMAAILAGVSTRKYASILQRGLEAKGVSKGTISRKVIKATKPMVEEFRKRSLKERDFVVLIFDGIHVSRRQMLACVGIDTSGRKHALGLRLGATENDIVCRDLIRDMLERGLDSEKRYLFVIDGSRALVSAIHSAFGQNAVIQRCQEHKIRDVQAYLPKKQRREIREKMQAAYGERTEKQALKRLDLIRSELSLMSDNAVQALSEGLYETVTLHRLGITGLLRKSLRTTNIIESAFSSVRRYMGRVTKFKDEEQINTWVMRSLVEAERHFRVVPGNRQLRKLKEKLEALKPQTTSLLGRSES